MVRGSLNTSVWICIIKSPPLTYSITKHRCSCKQHMNTCNFLRYRHTIMIRGYNLMDATPLPSAVWFWVIKGVTSPVLRIIILHHCYRSFLWKQTKLKKIGKKISKSTFTLVSHSKEQHFILLWILSLSTLCCYQLPQSLLSNELHSHNNDCHCNNMWDIEHQTTVTWVWKHAIRLTRNGCRILFATSKMFLSDIRLSTSSRAITSPFFSAFMAKYSCVSLYWVNSTCLHSKHCLCSSDLNSIDH